MRVVIVIIGISIFTSIVLTNILALAFTDSLYKTYFQNSEDLHYAMQVVDYLRLGKPMDDNYYSAQAISHMEDVKNLVNFAKITNVVALFLIIADILYLTKKGKYKIIKKSLIAGAIISTLSIMSIFISAILDFDYSFIVFHKIFFTNTNWLFEPGDKLVQLFSLNFFMFFFEKLITNILITILVLLALVRFIPKNDSKNI